IPQLIGLGMDATNPLIDVLATTSHSLSHEVLPMVLNLLDKAEDGWNKTNALEGIAKNVPDSLFNQFIEIVQAISSGWMRARVFDKLSINHIEEDKIKLLVRKALLEYLAEIKQQKRENLLWAVDITLFS